MPLQPGTRLGPHEIAAAIGTGGMGGQFIMSRKHDPPDEPVTRLNVVLGWAETLQQRVPRGT